MSLHPAQRDILNSLSTDEAPTSWAYICSEAGGNAVHQLTLSWAMEDGQIPHASGEGATLDVAFLSLATAIRQRLTAYSATLAKIADVYKQAADAPVTTDANA